jgi:hypothetical protein
MNARTAFSTLSVLFCLGLTGTLADVPHLINFQGTLADSTGNPITGTRDVQFSLYADSIGGAPLWSEMHSAVDIADGVFRVSLGSVNTLSPYLFDGSVLWLGILVSPDVQELSSRQPFVSVPYGFRSQEADHAVASDSALIAAYSDTAEYAFTGAGDSDWEFVGNDIYRLTGNVGIGTDMPLRKLHVVSTLSGSGIKIQTPSAPSFYLENTGSTQEWAMLVEDGSGKFILSDVPDQRVFVDSTGNVGVGEPNPAEKLEVSGIVYSDTGGFKFPDGTIQTTAAQNFALPYNDTTATMDPAFSVTNIGYGTAIQGWGAMGQGVYGRSDSCDGVVGYAEHWTRSGVYGQSIQGIGVKGESDMNDGVVGYTMDQDRSGVYGYGDGVGVTGITNGPNDGIYGSTASTDRYHAGVHGSNNGGGIGVYGNAEIEGVYGLAIADAGVGVHGKAEGANAYGIYGEATDQDGYGGYFVGSAVGCTGIYAEGSAGGCAAVFGGNVAILGQTVSDTVVELGEGLDYAEGFDVTDESMITPGTVMIIDPDCPGKLTISDRPYDSKVAGIVAGAKGLGSGVRLGSGQFDYNVALAGRVYCNVDAAKTGVEPGDLLTTSSKPGYAMKASDCSRAPGAILGKAMERLEKGNQGQILVLVTLQ